MKKILGLIVVTLLLVLGTLNANGIEENQYSNNGAAEVYDYEVVSEVMEATTKAVAVIIDFKYELPNNWNLKSAFSVCAELLPVEPLNGGPQIGNSAAAKAPRTIVKAYTSDKPEIGAPNQGQYVIIELDPNDFNAQSYYSYVQSTMIRQIIPYEENMKYEIDLLYDLNALAPNITETVPGIDPLVISEKASFNNVGSKTLIADEFVSGVFELPSNQMKKAIGYKFYTPEGISEDQKVPLVVFLHGRGQTHDYANFGEDFLADVDSPLYHNEGGTTWVKRAKEDCFVVVPQNPDWLLVDDPINHAPGWMGAEVTNLILGLVDALIEENPQIDTDRLYLTGLSLGAMGSWPIIANPDPAISEKFAAAALMSGSAAMGPIERLKAYENFSNVTIPLWLFHADNDLSVNRLGDRYAFCAISGKAVLNDETEEVVPEPGIIANENAYLTTYIAPNRNNNDVEVRFTEYKYGDGTNFLEMNMGTRIGHFIWEIAYKDQEVIDWLFSMSK